MTPLALAAFDKLAKACIAIEEEAVKCRQAVPAECLPSEDLMDLSVALWQLSTAAFQASGYISDIRFEEEVEQGLRTRYVPPVLPTPRETTTDDLFATFS